MTFVPAPPASTSSRAEKSQKDIAATLGRWPSVLLFLAWLGVVTVVVLPDGLSTRFEYCCGHQIGVAASTEEIRDYFGGADAGSYAAGGLMLAETGSYPPPGQVPLWPPGMFRLHEFMHAQSLVPAAQGLILLTILLWATFLFALARLAILITGRRIAALTPLLLLATPPLLKYYFDIGIFYSEPISTAFWGLGAVVLIEAGLRNSVRLSVLAGLLLGIAGFFRDTFQMIVTAITIGTLALAISSYVLSRASQRLAKRPSFISRIAHALSAIDLRALVIAVIAAQFLILPQKFLNLQKYGEFRWTFADYYFELPWKTDEEFPPAADFELTGGINVACKVNADECERFQQLRNAGQPVAASLYKTALFKTIVNYFPAYFREKSPFIQRFWVSVPTFGAPVPNPLYVIGYYTLAAIVGLLGSIILFFRLRIAAPALTFGALASATFAIALILHEEARYFYPLQILSPAWAFLACVMLLNPRRLTRFGVAASKELTQLPATMSLPPSPLMDQALKPAAACSLSVVVPIFNEEESLPFLVEKLTASLSSLGQPFEIVAVNDGSRDGSMRVLRELAAKTPALKVVSFRRNSGQTAAMMAGIDHAQGDLIITIDADLQNDPADIPSLLDKLDEGYDVVSGWRKDRQDAAIRRNFVSRVANRLISRLTGISLHDYGCSLKVYRRDVIKDVRLYGEMHRFIPIYAHWLGARVTETPVRHHARQFGESKYGLNRIFKVLLDLMVILFFERYLVKPIYVFGSVGLAMLGISATTFFTMIVLKVFNHTSFISTPLPILAAVFGALSVLSFLLGILAEIMMRTYFESQGKRAYNVRELINLSERVE